MSDLFVADESVDRPIVEALRAQGVEVLYIAEMDPGMRRHNLVLRHIGCTL